MMSLVAVPVGAWLTATLFEAELEHSRDNDVTDELFRR